MRRLTNQSGFTLIELMLAMGLFSIILIVSTTGFIGMNRVYTRGAIKKQLSESITYLSNNVSSVVRSPQSGASPIECSQADPSSDTCPGGWFVQCLSGARYLWQNNSTSGGLFKDTKSCSEPPTDDKEQIIDKRFIVQDLDITALPNDLYSIQGVVRTTDLGAFTVSEDDSPIPTDGSVSYSAKDMRCRGSSAGSIVQTCAIESFSVVVNSGSAT